MDMPAATVARLFATSRPSGAAPRPGAILIHASTSRACIALTDAAVEVANLFGARLVAVSAPVERMAGWGVTAAEQAAQHRLLEAAGEAFEARARPVRAGMAWRRAEGPPHAALAAHAWAADLVMLDGASGDMADVDAAAIGGLARAAARPLLLALPPRAGGYRRVAVLWDGSAACRRAVAGALPFIARAEVLVLLDGGPGAGALGEGLALRGAAVRVERRTRDRSAVGSARQLREAAPDLIVHGIGAWPAPWRPSSAELARQAPASRLVSA